MKNVWNLVRRLHGDDRGAEGLEKLLIIAAIVLPMLALLIFFGKDLKEWVTNLWEQVKTDAQT